MKRLQSLLDAADQERLERPAPNGKWSVHENVRHLLFAENAHLGRFAQKPLAFSPLGLPPRGLQREARLQALGTVQATTIEVFAEWAALHASLREHLLADTEPVRKALDVNVRHLRNHVTAIERLLRRKD